MNQSYELMLFLAKVSSKEELIKMLSDRTEKYASIPECDKEEAFRAISAICSLVITKDVLSSKEGAARLEASMEGIEDQQSVEDFISNINKVEIINMEEIKNLKPEELIPGKFYKIYAFEEWIFQFKSFGDSQIYVICCATLHDGYFDGDDDGLFIEYNNNLIYEASEDEIALFNKIKEEN